VSREGRRAAAAKGSGGSGQEGEERPAGPLPIRRAPDGQRLIVARPSDPRVPLALARAAHAAQSQEAFGDIPADAEAAGVIYTFRGYLAAHPGGWIVDEEGRVLERLQPGDSFLTPGRKN